MSERKNFDCVYVPIDSIRPYEKNPRLNDQAVDNVADSIKTFGFQSPIIVDENNEIICGHTRYKAAKKLGLLEVPVHVAKGLSDTQVKAFRIRDNKSSELAEWDTEILLDEILDIEAGGLTVVSTGFTEVEIQALRDSIAENVVEEGETNPDAEVEAPEEPVSVRGEIYQLGPHRLMCGDSTTGDVAFLMRDDIAGMVFTDPPYGVSYVGTQEQTDEMIANDDLRGEELHKFLQAAFLNIEAYLRKRGAFYVWYASNNHIEFETALRENKLRVKQILIWYKGFTLGRSDYQYAYEPCMYGCRADENCEWLGDRKQSTVWEVKRDVFKNYVHPTQKPTLLAQTAIFNSSREGEIVLDLFSGSGSTLIACEQTRRIFRGMEFDPKYVDVIRKRWAEFVHGEGCDWQALTPAIRPENNTNEEEQKKK